MNIQKINFNQNFGAIIGPYLSDEIAKKKNFVQRNPNKAYSQRAIKDLNKAVNTINRLLPEINGSPVIVDIGLRTKNQIKKNKRVKKMIFEYVIKNESGSFSYQTQMDGDEQIGHVRYLKLISVLKDLSARLAEWI